MEIDSSKYKILTWKSPVLLHWILNPGLAINEVVLGQRVPKVSLIEKNLTKQLAEKTFIPCPYCNTIHSSLKWSTQNKTAFSNWFGLYCDNCSNIIPCVTNLTSYILLGITFPIWYWFKDRLKKTWLEEQKTRFSKPLKLTATPINWWKIGLIWGFFMFVAMSIVTPLLRQEVLTKNSILIAIPIWTIGGLLFGLLMKKYNGGNPN